MRLILSLALLACLAGTGRAEPPVANSPDGRLQAVASGKTITEAQQRTYAAVDRIQWPEGFCRRDIGWQAVEREKAKS